MASRRPVEPEIAVERSVLSALDAELAGMGVVGRSSLAESARVLARQLDSKPHPLVSTEFRQTMAALREQAPAKQEADGIDQLASRRTKRRSAG